MDNQNTSQAAHMNSLPPPYSQAGLYPTAPPSYASQSGCGGVPTYPTAPYPGAVTYPGPPYPTAYGGPCYPTPYDTAAGPQVGFKAGQGPYGQGYGGQVPTAPQPYGQVGNDDVRLMDGANVSASGSSTNHTVVDVNLANIAGGWTGLSFSDKSIRRAFIRKVCLILMVQLAVTFGIVCLFIFCEPLKHWVRGTGSWFYFMAYVMFLVTYIVLVCCPGVRRSWPSNIICLAIFTLAFSYMAGTISSFHETDVVLIAMGITAAVCLSLAVFAIQTKIDFTMCSGILFALCMVVIFFGLACIIGGAFVSYESGYIMRCVYGGLAALLFSLFLVYDIQMLVGGHKYELSPEEYIFGSLQIYLDVVYLFLIILSLFGSKN